MIYLRLFFNNNYFLKKIKKQLILLLNPEVILSGVSENKYPIVHSLYYFVRNTLFVHLQV
jgi:hypothetical protein